MTEQFQKASEQAVSEPIDPEILKNWEQFENKLISFIKANYPASANNSNIPRNTQEEEENTKNTNLLLIGDNSVNQTFVSFLLRTKGNKLLIFSISVIDSDSHMQELRYFPSSKISVSKVKIEEKDRFGKVKKTAALKLTFAYSETQKFFKKYLSLNF